VRAVKNIPSKLFKYVPEQFAQAFASGVVRIGTFSSYSALEGARRDEAEGIVAQTYSASFTGMSEREPEKVAALWEMGIGVSGCKFGHYSVTKSDQPPDLYCLCFSTAPTPHLEAAKGCALFEIIKPAAFVRRLSKLNQEKLGNLHTGMVRYLEKVVPYIKDLPVLPNPLVKDTSFREEAEFRFIWEPYERVMSLPVIDTPTDEYLASCVRRIG
jgi:hypothetical protein